MGRSDTL
jgi:26S proteasome regulatory subunit N7